MPDNITIPKTPGASPAPASPAPPAPTDLSRSQTVSGFGDDEICGLPAPAARVTTPPADPPGKPSQAATFLSRMIGKVLEKSHLDDLQWVQVAGAFKKAPSEIISQLIVSHANRLFEVARGSSDSNTGNGNLLLIQNYIEGKKDSLTAEAKSAWDSATETHADVLENLQAKGYKGGMPRYTDG